MQQECRDDNVCIFGVSRSVGRDMELVEDEAGQDRIV